MRVLCQTFCDAQNGHGRLFNTIDIYIMQVNRLDIQSIVHSLYQTLVLKYIKRRQMKKII